MDKERKKALRSAYKDRLAVGGVYIIRNHANGKMLLLSTSDLQGSKNQFDFSKRNNSLCHLKIQEDWKKFGSDKFSFEVLEELKMQENQLFKEFREEIKLLEQIWLERLAADKLY